MTQTSTPQHSYIKPQTIDFLKQFAHTYQPAKKQTCRILIAVEGIQALGDC